MAKQGQGVALDPPGAKPLDLKYMKINGFPKAVGLWWVQGKALALRYGFTVATRRTPEAMVVLRSRGGGCCALAPVQPHRQQAKIR